MMMKKLVKSRRFCGLLLAAFAPGIPGAVATAAPAGRPGAPAQAVPTDTAFVTYAIRKGDTLMSLARAYLVAEPQWRIVMADNRIADPLRLQPGRTLRIRRALLRYRPISLRIAAASGPVTVQAPGMPAAVPLAAGAATVILGEGARFATGANGFVTIAGTDGSRISLPSHSMVLVARARRYLINDAGDIDIEVGRGRADIRAAKQAPQGEFRLRTPVAVSAVRGTEFRVGHNDMRALSTTEVLEGRVAVASGGSATTLPPGRGLAATTQSMVEEALLPAPALDRPGRVQTEAQLTFRISLPAGGQTARLQIARDAGFVDTVAEVEQAGGDVTLPGVANGNWFVRASARAASGIEGVAETWTFRRQRVGLTAASGPAGIPDGFRFDWQAEGEGRSVYRFQLFTEASRDGPLIDEPGLSQTGMTITHLDPGTYRWRVGVTQTDDHGTAEVWSPLEKFTVSR